MSDVSSFQTRTDWRWKLAIRVLGRNVVNLDRVTREFDETTRQVITFKYDYDRGLGYRHPAYESATELYFANSPMKAHIEGGLLSGAEPSRVAQSLGAPTELVVAYHDLFFDVRDRLDNDGWISSVVFGGFVHMGASVDDPRDLALRVAWLGGWDLFYHLVAKGFTNEEMQDLQQLVVATIASRRSLGMAFTAGNYPGSMEFIRTYLEMRRKDREEPGSGDEDVNAVGRQLLEQFAARVLGHDGGMGRSSTLVADVSDENNMKLPAREKRAANYEVMAQ